MGLKVTTDGKSVTVYRQDKTSSNGKSYAQYSLGISSKDKDGNWVNGFMDCQFKKGVDVPNKSKIEIANAFPTVSDYNGKKYTKIFVLDFTVVESGEAPKPAPSPNEGDFMNIPDNIEELPFA